MDPKHIAVVVWCLFIGLAIGVAVTIRRRTKSVKPMTCQTGRGQRPVTVTLGVILLAISLTIGVIVVLLANPSDISPTGYVLYTLVLSLSCLLLWFIFKGKNWARWLFLVMFSSRLSRLWISIEENDGVTLDIVIYFTQMLLCVVAAIALFLPYSTAWFQRNKN